MRLHTSTLLPWECFRINKRILHAAHEVKSDTNPPNRPQHGGISHANYILQVNEDAKKRGSSEGQRTTPSQNAATLQICDKLSTKCTLSRVQVTFGCYVPPPLPEKARLKPGTELRRTRSPHPPQTLAVQVLTARLASYFSVTKRRHGSKKCDPSTHEHRHHHYHQHHHPKHLNLDYY